MKKSELVDEVAKQMEGPKTVALKAVNAVLNSIKNSLASGNPVTLVGFGTFGIRDRKKRKGRNPRTGEVISIKAAKVPTFRAGKTLKDAVNVKPPVAPKKTSKKKSTGSVPPSPPPASGASS
jgi:DNA-binding protein HU-beta